MPFESDPDGTKNPAQSAQRAGRKSRNRRPGLFPQIQKSLRSKQQALELARGLTSDVLVQRAIEVTFLALHAVDVKSMKYDPRMISEGQTTKGAKKRLDEMLGSSNYTLFHDRLVWMSPEWQVQMAAAREVLERKYPHLNKIDPGTQSSYRIRRVDPNTVDVEVKPPEKKPETAAGDSDDEEFL